MDRTAEAAVVATVAVAVGTINQVILARSVRAKRAFFFNVTVHLSRPPLALPQLFSFRRVTNK